MADDLRWEAVILITVGRWCTHATSVAHLAGVGQAAQQVDKAIQIDVSGDLAYCTGTDAFGTPAAHRGKFLEVYCRQDHPAPVAMAQGLL
jgi:hypothetical protein